jgi:hypothetical protein
MSSKSLPAGNAAASAFAPNLAEPDSPDGCEAPPAESGAGGAPPSNTAPHNSKDEGPPRFRLLRLAVDSLYLSYPGDLSASAVAVLTRLRDYARSEHPEEQAKAQYPLAGHVFEVKDKGAGRFPFVLVDNAFRIQLSNPGKKLPMAYVQIGAEYLAHKGPKGAAEALEAILLKLCDTEAGWHGRESVSRIDLAADFVSGLSMESWSREAWVTRATEIHSYAVDGNFTGWTVGLRGAIGCRLYDKVREIFASRKPWVMNQWIPAGWTGGEPVWRLEFELKRDFLKERGFRALDDVLENLNGLWSYATTEWLRLTVPNPQDSTRTRWPVHPFWIDLASVDWQSALNVPLQRFSNSRVPNDERQIAVMLGALSSYMASHRIDDRNTGIDELLSRMYEHYGVIAARKGQTFDDLLAHRVALKAREFNTAVNAPGLVDSLRQDAQDEGAEAYRRATRGW